MKLLNLLIATLSVVCLTVKSSHAQSESWDTRAIGPSTYAVASVNVQRISQAIGDTEVGEKFARLLLDERDVTIDEIDHVQMLLGGEDKKIRGPDGVTHTKAVFLEAQSFNAERVGKMSGYSLREEQWGDHTVYLGKYDGAWGGFAVSDRAVVFAVPRRAKIIVDELDQEYELQEWVANSNKDVDLSVSFLGAPSATVLYELFADADLEEHAELISRGRLECDFASDQPIVAEFHTDAEEDAARLAALIKASIRGGSRYFNQQVEGLARNIDPNGNQPEWAVRIHDAYAYFAEILRSLEITQDGKIVRMVSNHDGGFPKAIPMMLETFLEDAGF